MLNNLLRCDLCHTQLEALSEAKGQWWLVDDNYFLEDDILLRDWNGFKFYQYNDLFYDITPLYIVTPQGYFIASGFADESEEGVTQEQLKEAVEDAIATLLNFPESQGQLTLFEVGQYVAN